MIDLLLEHLPLILDADGDGKRIRDVILQLAVRGRLVRQEEGDRDSIVRLGSVISLVSGRHLRPDQYNQEGRGIAYSTGPSDFVDGSLEVSRWTDEREAIAIHGDVLLTVKGSGVGSTCVVRIPEVAISRQLMAMRAKTDNPDYLAITARSLQDQFSGAKRGVAIPGISRGDVLDQKVYWPPLAEQHRIVAKVDELMGHAAVLEERHLAASSARVRLRDAALHALAEAEDHEAVETAWSRIEEHFDDLFTEPEDVAPLRQAIVDCLMGIGLASAFGGVVRKPLGAVLDGIDAGRSPQCLDRPRVGREWGILKVSACTGIRFRPEENKCAPPNFQVDQSHEVCVGDILMARCSGNVDLVGRTVMVEQVDPHLALCDKTLRLRPCADLAPRYLLHLLQTSGVRAALVSAAAGGGGLMRNISQRQLREVPLEIAPTESQHRIVAKVDELMALCDTLEASLTRAKAAREQFAASISAALEAESPISPDHDAA